MKTVKKILIRLLLFWISLMLLAVVVMCIPLFHNYDGEENGGDGFVYLIRDPFKKAAVRAYTYDPESGGSEIVIPESYGEYPVKGLGGYVGRGAPSPFMIYIRGVHFTESVGPKDGSFAWYAEQKGVEIEFVDLTLKLGPEIREIHADQDRGERSGDRLYVVRLYVECDPLNPEFYSEDGVLYTKDGKVVEGLHYRNSFETPEPTP